MLISMYYLRDCIVRLNSMHKLLEKVKDDEENGIDLDTVKSNFYGITLEMSNALAESAFGLNQPYMFSGTLMTLKHAIKSVQNSDERVTLLEAIEVILAPYAEYDFEMLEASSYKENFRYSHMYDEAGVDPEVIKSIAESIRVHHDRTINVIDPRCRQGVNAAAFKRNYPHSKLWGMGLSENKLEETKKRFDRVALGTLKGSNVSNDVFDVLLLQPDISLERAGERLLIKKEKELMLKALNYLRTGGVVVLALPFFRFYKDICLFMAKNFSNLQIRKYESTGFNKSGIVYVTGVRKVDREIDEDDYTSLRYAFDFESIPDIMEQPFEPVTLPSFELDVKSFRGSILDPDEVRRIYESSPCVAQFWGAQQVEKLSENAKNPLLPFNVGQLGLVLTSGCLDGVVDEGNGHFHVVKGRVIKKVDSASDVDMQNNQVEVIETTSNRVEINVFLPDGMHKILA
jgi:hypothetical protein